MQLSQLVSHIESLGYRMLGDKSLLPDGNVERFPLVLIPKLPAIEQDCQFLNDALPVLSTLLPSFAKLDGAAVVSGSGFTIVHLQFLRNSDIGGLEPN